MVGHFASGTVLPSKEARRDEARKGDATLFLSAGRMNRTSFFIKKGSVPFFRQDSVNADPDFRLFRPKWLRSKELI